MIVQRREQLEAITSRIAAACQRSERSPRDVTLIAVSKEQPDDAVREFYDLGVRDFGENKVQSLSARVALGLAGVRWHQIGPLQTNKAKDIARLSSHDLTLHTIDRVELVAALAKRLERSLPCLVQVDIDREPQKAGVLPEAIDALVDAIAACGRLELRGLMAIPRPVAEVGEAALRRSFDAMRELGQRLGTTILSMGMSDDFELAIEHGSTHVRVGTALFGPRARPL